MEDDKARLARFAREMAELGGGAEAAEPAAPRIVSKTISAAPQRTQPVAEPVPAPVLPVPVPVPVPVPSWQHPVPFWQQPAPAAGSAAGDSALADSRNAELRNTTAAAAAQAHFEAARELAAGAQAHLAMMTAAAHAGPRAPLKRAAAGSEWEDPTMADWPENDFRLFVGNLGNDATDQLLQQAFSKYPSFQRARAVRDKRYDKPAGYGFVSFKEPWDMTAAMREMNNKFVGSRPVKLKKSNWKERSAEDEQQPNWEYHNVKKIDLKKIGGPVTAVPGEKLRHEHAGPKQRHKGGERNGDRQLKKPRAVKWP
ncbi:hypothetical protein T492DRAFT_1059693 [Pavlovales sp. CCMP2436]|nr:hypothetical protein T492DRAFT_1059693 [Pavlovales sp. CCMP2436]|mmetsp:Transcript_47891/g.111921  ORF Transcript_47891/g.111921 Transcript_47891/m.111921 type:complete len:312 (+) Transcript_47891:74-1009(+)